MDINFSLFPNPSSGDVFLTLSEDFIRDIDISVYDLTGKLIINNKVKYYTPFHLIDNKSANGKNLDPGLYIVRVQSGSKLTSKKLILR